MEFVTNRTEMDTVQGMAKGFYNHEDLNRVESAVQELCEMAKQIGVDLKLTVKTDWGTPGNFDAEKWPTERQMERYIKNIHAVCAALDLNVHIPTSMRHLTTYDANNIEIALQKAYEEILRRMSV